eukprot:1152347-Amphidinium_carterae.1
MVHNEQSLSGESMAHNVHNASYSQQVRSESMARNVHNALYGQHRVRQENGSKQTNEKNNCETELLLAF